MSEEIFKLWEIPMKRPSILGNAVKFINQAQLIALIKGKTKLSRANLVSVAELAIKNGDIKGVKARLPDGKVLSFVDLVEFSQEFDQFILAVTQHKSKITEAEIIRLLTKKDYKFIHFKRVLLQWITSYSWSLLWFERFCLTPSDFIRLANKTAFSASQIHEEIEGLLNLIAKKRPKDVLEIGAEKGGTLYLFTKVADDTATLVSADLKIANQTRFLSFARMRQHVIPIQGNSQDAITIEAIKRQFPAGVDFLFLDGDHSYDGIKNDFQNYSSLVRSGGLIAFHDIVKDNETRYGVVTGGWSGGVPRFWEEIKAKYRHVEFIHDNDQDGLGIGVIFIEFSQNN